MLKAAASALPLTIKRVRDIIKSNMKKLLIPFVVFLYLMQISFIVLLFLPEELFDSQYALLLYVPTIVLGSVAAVLGLVNLVFGCLQISRPAEDVYKTVMIIKLVLVPFFIINFVLSILFSVTFVIIPFMAFAGIIIALLLMLMTYAITMVTSVYNICYSLYRVRTLKHGFFGMIVPFVFQFFFVLDCVGSILFYIKEKNDWKMLRKSI